MKPKASRRVTRRKPKSESDARPFCKISEIKPKAQIELSEQNIHKVQIKLSEQNFNKI